MIFVKDSEDMDKKIKWVNRATGLVITLVAIFAAIVSYTHIYNLSQTNHQLGVDPYLIPLSVDMLILGSSLGLLYLAWKRLPVPWLIRLTLWAGIGVTVFANVMDGYTYGPLSAAISAWPACAFVLTVESAMQIAKVVRRTSQVLPGDNRTLEEVKADYDRKKHGPIEVIKLANEKPEVSYGDPDVRNVPSKKSVKASAYYDLTHKLPTIQSIQDELDCTQYEARQIWLVMRDTKCDMAKAILIREEAKKGGKEAKHNSG